ncbi:MAG: HPr family phosphocarrier protein [Vallitaleaceae bacterium]|nr:HPr family phosphocarrier protein [Vallitaleaceae bacterium]
MVSKEITVKIASGFESRPVAMFVQVASQFKSNIYVSMQEKKVNAKSIMGMMSLGVIEGESITISADGEDEASAMNQLESYLTEVE